MYFWVGFYISILLFWVFLNNLKIVFLIEYFNIYVNLFMGLLIENIYLYG